MAPRITLAGAGSIPIPVVGDTFEDWVFGIARWWDRLHPREIEMDVWRPETPAGLGTTTSVVF